MCDFWCHLLIGGALFVVLVAGVTVIVDKAIEVTNQ